MHDLVLALWTCQIRQGVVLCKTLGREESECHASVLVESPLQEDERSEHTPQL